jgi:hypothetical protein
VDDLPDDTGAGRHVAPGEAAGGLGA